MKKKIICLVISMLLFATALSVAGNTNNNETNINGNATLNDVFTMIIEDTMSVPGAENHQIPITGEWSEPFQRLVMKILLDKTDFDGFRVINDGSVLEGLGSFSVQNFPTYINVFFTCHEGNAVPAGEGTLLNMEIDISGDAPAGPKFFNFTDYSPSIPTAYYPDRNNFDNPYIPDLFNGTLIIGYNDPPETPDIEGPTEGIVDEEYEFTIVAHDPDDNNITYYVAWGNGNQSFGPYPSDEPFQATRSWSEADTYEITVIANDGYADSPEATHPIEIIELLPEIEIGEITGGLLNVAAIVTNTGNVSAANVEIKMSVKGGILGLINVSANKTIENLNESASESISASPIIGMGPIEINVTASADEVEEVSETKNGFVFFVFVIIK